MWRQRQTESPWSNSRITRGVAQLWFRYLFPLSFVAASFLRPSTVAGVVYIVLAFLALLLPASCAKYEASRWRRLHLAICLLCGSIFIAAATFLILCRQDMLQRDALFAAKLLFFGKASCHDGGTLLPEILAFATSFFGWILGCYTKRMEEAPPVDVLANPLMSWKRLLAVAVILFGSASLDFNAFALVYHIATLSIVLYWAGVKLSQFDSSKEARSVELICLRFVLLAVCSSQVICVEIFTLPGIPVFFSAPVARLLGFEVSVAVCWQNLASFLVIQLLVWPAKQRHARLLPTQTFQEQRIFEAPSALLHKPAEDQTASPPARENKRHRAEDDLEAEEPGEGSDLCALTWRSVADKARFCSSRALLPMLSMMSLFMVWPSLMTLPLLLMGFALHHVPVDRFPLCFFYAALVYEIICSITWFSYNVSCTMSDQPLSRVPYEFTWLERAGLQCYLRQGPLDAEARRYFFALGQGLAVVATAACARSRRWQARHYAAEDPSRPPRIGHFASSSLVRKVVAFSRPITVSFVVLVILGQSSPNVFGILYLLWLLGLVVSGALASYVHSGWDLLRANELTWRGLLVLSNGIVLALAYFQVMEMHNFDFVGLQRSAQTILEVTWAHLTIGVLAGLQTLAFSQKVQIPAMFVDSNSALAWFLWIAGIFIAMGLMLNYVMIKPLTVDSFFILILFLGIVAVEQFGAPACWRNWLLTATSFSCSLLLLLRYALLMPKVNEWLTGVSSPLPEERFGMVWKAFALRDISFQVRLKLGYLAATMLLSASLRRLYRFGAAASLVGARSQVCVTKNKAAMAIFLEAARWSTVVLICTCYFIMPLKNALSHLQLAVLILMLMSGRCWDYAGGFISLTSSVTLLVQYSYTFKLVELPEDQANYWGLHQEGYYAEVALLLLGIVQRTVKRASRHFLTNTTVAAQLNEQAHERRRRIRQETVAYGAQIGATILLLAAMVCNSAWSVVYVTAIMLYVCKKESRRSSSARTSNSWLRLFVLLLALSLAVSLAIKAWLPPDILARPTVKDIADLLCKSYADSPAVASRCSGEGCHTERFLCGQTWAFWLGFEEPQQARGDTTFTFMAFFSVCVLRHICLVEIGKETARKESENKADIEEPAESVEPEEPDGTSPTQVDAEVASEEVKKRTRVVPHLSRIGSSIILIISMALAALLQPHSNLFTLSYLFLLVWYIFASEGVRGGETTLASRWKVNRWIFAWNLVFAWALCLFQCPAVPCAFAAPLDCAEEACPSTFLVSPSLCRELSEKSTISFDGNWKPITILLEWIGVQKFPQGLTFVWCRMWIFLVFAASLIQDLAFDRWQELFDAHLRDQVQIRGLRERWYHEHLLHWRRYELRRVDTKHKVLMVKLQSLMAYIRELRAIWESKRGELTVEERAQRARGDRILNLCLESGHYPQVVEPLLEEFSAEAAAAAGPCEHLLTGGSGLFSAVADKDKPSAKDPNTLEVLQKEALESINSYVLEHLQDIQLQRLRRISSQDLSERKIQLLQRCAAVGEALQCSVADTDATAPKEAEVPPERSGSLLRLKAGGSHIYRRQNTQEFMAAEKDSLRKSFSLVKDKLLELANYAVSSLVDDFLYTCDSVETLQSHRKHDGFLTLICKAFWSQTLPLLLVVSLVRFATYTSVMSAVTICAMVVSLMSFPHQHSRFWKILIYFNMSVVLIKVLYQLPIFPVSANCSGLQEDLEHGLLSGIPVPWESVLGLMKVAPQLEDQESMVKALSTCLKQLENRDLFRPSLFALLWPDLLVCAFLVCHWHTLRNSGRLANPALICCRLALDDDMRMRRPGRRLTLQVVKDPSSASRMQQKHLTRGLSDLPGSPCARDEQGRWKALQTHLRNALSAVLLRKPAMDLFVPRAFLMMCCFCIIVVSWDRLIEGGESFADSLTSNSFSGQQVVAVVVFLVLIVQVRAEYTWYTLWRGPQANVQDKQERTETPFAGSRGACAKSKLEQLHDNRVNLAVVVVQRILFVAELIALHSIFITQWAISTKDTPRMSNAVQLTFYIFFMLYLILTSLQMRYDVHVTSGGVGLTHSMNFFSNLAFKAYLAVPFAEEMRVLTDWTITRTSMDFFMWMKLEDAQQSLYRTKRDFYLRRWYPPAAPRPQWEKALQGGLLLVGLVVLIVAPIALFSTLNPSLQANRLTSATLSGNLIIQSSAEGIRQLQLYKGSQVSIVQEPGHSDKSRDAAEVSFAIASDETFDSEALFQARMAETLGQPDVTAWFQFKYDLQFNGDTLKGVSAHAVRRVELPLNTRTDIGRLVNESLDLGTSEKAQILIPDALQATIRVNANLEVQFLGDWFDLYLAFQPAQQDLKRRQIEANSRGRWKMAKVSCEGQEAVQPSGEPPPCPITQLVASEKSTPVPVGASTSWSVMGIYLGVVYTIGRLLRNVFQDSSKRVIYEEIPDTSLLEDLCNGIYIARIQHLLRTEYKLYYQLMSILRSPELLLNVTGNFCNRNFHDEVDISEEADDYIPGVQAGPKTQAELLLTAVAEVEQESEETYVVPQSSDPPEDLRVLDEMEDDLGARFVGVVDAEHGVEGVLAQSPTSPFHELRRRNQGLARRGQSHLEM